MGIKTNQRANLQLYGSFQQVDDEGPEPPEDFRNLSVNPTFDELFNRKPFLREIKTKGPFKDLSHYLDVNFRLLKEDFMNELRQGY